MKQSKKPRIAHTPAPWGVEKAFREPGLWVSSAADTSIVARVYEQGGLGANNAAIIAAAPELLESLRQVLIDFRTLDKGGMCDKLRSVEKAEWLIADLDDNDWDDPDHETIRATA